MAEDTLGGVRTRELPFLAQIDLRANPETSAAAQGEPGLALPRQPNTAVVSGDRRVLWLGPDEWLVVAPPDARPGLEQDIGAQFQAPDAAVVDVSGQRTVIELAGPRARDVLMKGCSIDLHPSVFGPGRCARTALARAQVILLPVDQETYWIFVQSSFAAYLAEWLMDAMSEYT
jgi:sarcosine oxidase, subunit gamma